MGVWRGLGTGELRRRELEESPTAQHTPHPGPAEGEP